MAASAPKPPVAEKTSSLKVPSQGKPPSDIVSLKKPGSVGKPPSGQPGKTSDSVNDRDSKANYGILQYEEVAHPLQPKKQEENSFTASDEQKDRVPQEIGGTGEILKSKLQYDSEFQRDSGGTDALKSL